MRFTTLTHALGRRICHLFEGVHSLVVATGAVCGSQLQCPFRTHRRLNLRGRAGAAARRGAQRRDVAFVRVVVRDRAAARVEDRRPAGAWNGEGQSRAPRAPGSVCRHRTSPWPAECRVSPCPAGLPTAGGWSRWAGVNPLSTKLYPTSDPAPEHGATITLFTLREMLFSMTASPVPADRPPAQPPPPGPGRTPDELPNRQRPADPSLKPELKSRSTGARGRLSMFAR